MLLLHVINLVFLSLVLLMELVSKWLNLLLHHQLVELLEVRIHHVLLSSRTRFGILVSNSTLVLSEILRLKLLKLRIRNEISHGKAGLLVLVHEVLLLLLV